MLELDAAPGWVIDLLKSGRAKRAPAADKNPLVELDRPEAIAKAVDWLRNAAPEAVEGDAGDHTTFRVAARLRDMGLSRDVAFDVMAEHWNEAGKASPPWGADDLKQKVDNAFAYATGAWGGALGVAEFGDTTSLSQGEVKPKFPIRDLGQLRWSNTSRYLVRGVMNYRMLCVVSGASNAGKSPFALDMAAAIAKGEPWQGHKTKKGFVLYIATEGWTALENRLEALRREHFPDGSNPAFSYAAMSLNLRDPAPGFVRDLCAFVKEKAAEFGVPPALIVIDTLSHALGGASDKDDDVGRAVIANCQKIATGTGAAMMLLHHPTKAADSDYRGTSVWLNDTDLLIKVEVDPKSKTRTVTTPRVKETAEIEPVHFRIKPVLLGLDQEGDEITSIVVEWLDDLADLQAPMRADDSNALDALEECAEQDPAGVGYTDWMTAFAELAKRIDAEGKPDKGLRSDFKHCLNRLRRAGLVDKTPTGKWLRSKKERSE